MSGLNLEYITPLILGYSDLFIFSLDDGSCSASIKLGEDGCKSSPTVGNGRPKPQDMWTWSSLSVSYIEDVRCNCIIHGYFKLIVTQTIVLVAAAASDNLLSALTPDNDEAVPDTSRCVILELATTPSEMRLHVLCQIDLHGPATGNGIYEEEDGKYPFSELQHCFFLKFLFTGSHTFYCISHDGHLILRDFILRAPLTSLKAPSTPDEENAGEHESGFHLSTLPLPNALRSMMTKSTEHLEDESQKSPAHGKSTLSEPHDAGMLVPDTVIAGSRTYYSADGKLYGLVWSYREICVSQR